MKFAFAPALGVVLLAPVPGAAQFQPLSVPVSLPSVYLPTIMPMRLPEPVRPTLLPTMTLLQTIPSAAAIYLPAAPARSIRAAQLPSNPLRLPAPAIPRPIGRTVLPGPADAPISLVFADAASDQAVERPSALPSLRRLARRTKPEPDQRTVPGGFDGARPAQRYTLPEEDLERELGLR